MRSKGEPGDGGESDGQLLRRLRDGDAAAFDALFARHRRGLMAYVHAMLGEAGLAEDVVQESFVELVRNRDRLDPRRGLTGWLYRVARNRAIDVQRRRAWEALPGDAEVTARRDEEPGAATAPELLMAREREEALLGALRGLPSAESEVLMLRYFGGLTFREVADAVQAPLGTVLWRAQRGLGRLRESKK
jgi:RNA polymerase sigma-70 factor (ECF subfamily)